MDNDPYQYMVSIYTKGFFEGRALVSRCPRSKIYLDKWERIRGFSNEDKAWAYVHRCEASDIVKVETVKIAFDRTDYLTVVSLIIGLVNAVVFANWVAFVLRMLGYT
jgi:hypothetical protein